ncbi:protein Niban 2a [Denticeps clupeoides]|uniref:PH domain-containing protein n=1 Tax=Denticeps clupeoides TaxID=299321 RepID=A0AAY4E657_9TELE|nr:niban-like protein 1 [Denticeps clupeoides]
MGDVVSSHLDESRRELITARSRVILNDFSHLYEKQYAVALFNSVRFEIEGGGGTQSQLLHRKDALKGKFIFSGSLYKYLEENAKFRHRFLYVDDSYNINLYETKQAHDRGLHPKAVINCAGYRALTSMEEYVGLLNNSLPGVKAKAGSSPFLKFPSQYPLILWHPYAQHHYFCVMSEKEQNKWNAVLQDCVRQANNGLLEECKVQTPAFTDSLRRYRQNKGLYGTWDMMCGDPPQILANLVMETLQPELRNLIGPRLKGKLQQKQRSWILISNAVYKQVLSQTHAQYDALVKVCESQRPHLDAALRTDMDQIITSREHVTGKIRALMLPRVEQLLRSSVQPHVSSILEALMEPTSRGFAEVRDIFFRELVEVSKNTASKERPDQLGEHMEKLSMLAFHPVKMQSCYEKMEALSLDGLQQHFEVSTTSVFIQRAQILMKEEMDNAVYTFEQLLYQTLGSQGSHELCKAIQGCQDRVLKKYDYDSSSVRKKFFKESLLQIIVPYMLKHLCPSCTPELPRFRELIFEDFSHFILVEDVFEDMVLHCVSKDIKKAVKEVAVQRKHNLYRDSIILTDSDPNLHLLGENAIDWAEHYGVDQSDGGGEAGASKSRRRRQIVSMINLDGMPMPYESCIEVPGVEGIPEETEIDPETLKLPKSLKSDAITSVTGPVVATTVVQEASVSLEPKSPDCIQKIRSLINPVVEVAVPVRSEDPGPVGTKNTVHLEEGKDEQHIHTPLQMETRLGANQEDREQMVESSVDSDEPGSRHHDDSGFQSPTNEAVDEEEQAHGKHEGSLKSGGLVLDPEEVLVDLEASVPNGRNVQGAIYEV